MPARLPSSSRTAGIVGPLAALFAITFLCGSTPEEAQLFAKRRQRIAGMTHADIEQLKRNYEEFRKLSPERKKALQALDEEVKQDTTGHYAKLLAGYNRWLSSLSPFDQERIQSKTDPFERAQLVKTIRDEQLKRQALAAANGSAQLPATLHPTDFDATLKAVETNFLSPDARKKLPDELTGRARHLRILQLAFLQTHNGRDVIQGSLQSLISTLIEGIPDDNVKSRVMSRPSGRPRRQMLGQILGRTLVGEWGKEIANGFPSPALIDAEIERKMAAQSAAKQDGQRAAPPRRPGRRMVGIQMRLQNDEQFRDLGKIFFWLFGGFQIRPQQARTQPAASRMRTEWTRPRTRPSRASEVGRSATNPWLHDRLANRCYSANVGLKPREAWPTVPSILHGQGKRHTSRPAARRLSTTATRGGPTQTLRPQRRPVRQVVASPRSRSAFP
jgi:hypothetical protein